MHGRTIHVEHLGHDVRLVPRSQLRFTRHGRKFGAPYHLRGIATLPTPPATFDYSRGESIKFPMWWNNQLGDCYEEACLHASQTFTAWSGTQFQPDPAKVRSCYLTLSGGDNGLSDNDIMPAWKTGIPCPNGPATIIDEMTVDPNDRGAVLLAAWANGGLIWTCALLDTWQSNIKAGGIWDGNGNPDLSAGHAMFINGRVNGMWKTRTWGISPAINVTDAGIARAQTEFIVVFSRDQFNPATGLCVFTGMTWEQKRAFWKQCGGKDVGPSPFAPSPVTTTTAAPVIIGGFPKNFGISIGLVTPQGQTSPWSNGLHTGSVASGTCSIRIVAEGDVANFNLEPSTLKGPEMSLPAYVKNLLAKYGKPVERVIIRHLSEILTGSVNWMALVDEINAATHAQPALAMATGDLSNWKSVNVSVASDAVPPSPQELMNAFALVLADKTTADVAAGVKQTTAVHLALAQSDDNNAADDLAAKVQTMGTDRAALDALLDAFLVPNANTSPTTTTTAAPVA